MVSHNQEETKEKEDEDEDTEVKELKEKVDSLEKQVVEIKELIKKPIRKSKVEIQDKSKDFTEEKSKDPLDLIA